MRRLLSRLFRRARCEDGTATFEFVIVVPIIVLTCMASIEAGFYMTKHVLMERGLDMVIRDARLGNLGIINHDKLRTLICNQAKYLGDCENSLKVELLPVSTTTFSMPAERATCIDKGEPTKALTTVTPGSSHEIMVVRVCVVQDPMFPSTGIGLRLQPSYGGGYQLIATSVFVNEPR